MRALVLLLCAALTGCVSVAFERPDGTHVRVSSFLRSHPEGMRASFNPETGAIEYDTAGVVASLTPEERGALLRALLGAP